MPVQLTCMPVSQVLFPSMLLEGFQWSYSQCGTRSTFSYRAMGQNQLPDHINEVRKQFRAERPMQWWL